MFNFHYQLPRSTMLYYKTWISYDFISNITYIPEIYHRYQTWLFERCIFCHMAILYCWNSRVSMLSFGGGGCIGLSASTTPQLLHLHGLLMVGLRIENQPLNSPSFSESVLFLEDSQHNRKYVYINYILFSVFKIWVKKTNLYKFII